MIKTNIIGLGDEISSSYGLSVGTNYIDKLELFLPRYYPLISWNFNNINIHSLNSITAYNILNSKVLPLNPNIVFIMLGTYDACLNNNAHQSLTEFESNYNNIIEALLNYNNCTGQNNCIPIPVLITPPSVYGNPTILDVTNNRLNQYSYIIKSIAAKYNCPIIDIFSVFQDNSSTSLYQQDGIHLSKEGFNLLYDKVFQTFTRLITYEGLIKERTI